MGVWVTNFIYLFIFFIFFLQGATLIGPLQKIYWNIV
jgi:hypothetical protein